MSRQSSNRTSKYIFYNYLQKNLQVKNQRLFKDFVVQAINDLGVWFPPDSYKQLPIALPHVVRDASCRPNKNKPEDEWASPDALGYVRDDNSLVKGMVKSFDIYSPNNEVFFHNKRLGNGYVAAHAWRETVEGRSAQKNPLLNSFWPNLIWLPADLARLTDVEGSFTQRYVQALSLKIYENLEVEDELQKIIDESWELLSKENEIPLHSLSGAEDLNFFVVTERFIKRKIKNIRVVSNALRQVSEGKPIAKKVLSTRYTEGLPKVDKDNAKQLRLSLERYLMAVEC